MRIPHERVEQLLERWPVARLATIGASGRPHLVPIVFARVAGRVWSSIDGKPKRGATPVRIENIRRNARVSLLLDHYAADWTQLWWLRIDGDARVVEGEGDEQWAALSALREKYPQYSRVATSRSGPQLIRIETSAVQSWYAGPELPDASC